MGHEEERKEEREREGGREGDKVRGETLLFETLLSLQVLSWLEKNVKIVIERVSKGDPLVKQCAEK